MIKNIIFSLVLALGVGSANYSPRRVVIYNDYSDTSSFQEAYVLSNDELEYAEVFGVNDTYDYIKYTATHSRRIILETSTNTSATVHVSVFLASKGTSNVVASYYSGQETQNDFIVYVNAGDTIYFRIDCTGNCWWFGTIHLNLDPEGFVVSGLPKMYDYTLPHTGPASIYYGIKNSCNAFVPNQSYRYCDVIRQAAQIWNNVGDMHFVENSTLSAFDIDTKDVDTLDVYMTHTVLSGNYFVDELNISTNMDMYMFNSDIYPDATLYDFMISYMLKSFGVAMGLMLYDNVGGNNMQYVNNVMYNALYPYKELGNADIAAYIHLWGDATISE